MRAQHRALAPWQGIWILLLGPQDTTKGSEKRSDPLTLWAEQVTRAEKQQ